jgi:hypothetical protein
MISTSAPDRPAASDGVEDVAETIQVQAALRRHAAPRAHGHQPAPRCRQRGRQPVSANPQTSPPREELTDPPRSRRAAPRQTGSASGTRTRTSPFTRRPQVPAPPASSVRQSRTTLDAFTMRHGGSRAPRDERRGKATTLDAIKSRPERDRAKPHHHPEGREIDPSAGADVYAPTR